MRIPLGTFHNISAVGVSDDGISLLNSRGLETLIPIRRHYNRETKTWDPIEVSGQFGSFSKVVIGQQLDGLLLQDVREIHIEKEFEAEDFHCNSLVVRTGSGIEFQWELYCDGGSDEHPTTN